MPGLDPRIDYYTGMGDFTAAGGAYDVLSGYGPNTRTVMQFKVANTAPATALDVTALANAMPAAYAATQPKPVIPEAVYNAPFGTFNTNNYAAIGTGSGAIDSGLFTFTETDSAGVKTVHTLPVINKAIQELFDPVYGRMNATLAVELPFSTATVATTIPLAYIDSPVERLDAIADGETQIWKVTHNGVDSHPVHFHMVNVQVINRVAWDGQIRPPELNELGWKETLRMNPLEDVYVAVHAVHPVVPFGLPSSKRLLDPAQVENSGLGFTNIDPTTGQVPTTQTYLVNGVMTPQPTVGGVYTNKITSFDNEYVWHCHILGHEEQDFMRPFVFHPNVMVPDMPVLTSAATNVTTLTWTDPTPVTYVTDAKGVIHQVGVDVDGVPTAGLNVAANYVEPTSNTKNEIGFKVQESIDGGATYTTKVIVPANVTTWTGANAANTYRVLAYNVAGDSDPLVARVVQAPPGAPALAVAPTAAPALTGPAGPTGLTQTLNANGSVTLSWTGLAGATGYVVTVNGAVTACTAITATSCTVAAAAVPASANIAVAAQTLSGTTTATAVAGGLTNSPTADPVAFTGVLSAPGAISLTWANNPANKNNVANLNLIWTPGPAAGKLFPATSTGVTLIGLAPGSYSFTLQAVSNVTTFSSAVVALPTPVAVP
jgi:hypothetical protein